MKVQSPRYNYHIITFRNPPDASIFTVDKFQRWGVAILQLCSAGARCPEGNRDPCSTHNCARGLVIDEQPPVLSQPYSKSLMFFFEEWCTWVGWLLFYASIFTVDKFQRWGVAILQLGSAGARCPEGNRDPCSICNCARGLVIDEQPPVLSQPYSKSLFFFFSWSLLKFLGCRWWELSHTRWNMWIITLGFSKMCQVICLKTISKIKSIRMKVQSPRYNHRIVTFRNPPDASIFTVDKFQRWGVPILQICSAGARCPEGNRDPCSICNCARGLVIDEQPPVLSQPYSKSLVFVFWGMIHMS